MSQHGHHGPTLVGGRYELGELLGRGGMAEVRKGTDTRLGRVVAVKRLRTDLASDATFQARFRREAQSSASLNHPAIVSVYDTGEELATDGSGISQPYIVMEFVAGRTLRDILREGRKILPERALEITSGVLAALDYSHRAGIIHRDIKPGNVMLTPSGDVKVMDFGIARAISDASSAMTQTAAVVGTAQYLSPEQARGETVDSRSDVYSAGCLLYELLTGRPPFVGDSPVAVAYQHVREPAVPPSDHDTALTPEIDAIVMKSLAKRVEDRYQSAAAMRADIERYLAGHPVRATAPAAPTGAADHRRPDLRPAVPPRVAHAVDHHHPAGAATARRRRPRRQPHRPARLPRRAAGGADHRRRAAAAPAVRGPARAGAGARPDRHDRGAGPRGDRRRRAQRRAAGVRRRPRRRPRQGDPAGPQPRHVRRPRDDRHHHGLDGQADDVGAFGGRAGPPRPRARRSENAGLVPTFEEKESDEPRGQVVETRPAAGEQVPEGTRVTVFFSDGPEKVPDVVGMTRRRPSRRSSRPASRCSWCTSADTTEPKGTVIEQSPDGGNERPEGTEVTIVVSTFEEPTETPSPTESPTVTPTVPTETPIGRPSARRDPHSLVEEGRRAPVTKPGRDGLAVAGVRRRSLRDLAQPAVERHGVGDVEQAVVRRGGDLGLGGLLPAHGDVGLGGVAAVELEVVVAVDRGGQGGGVADAGDRVGLGVRHALELHAVADALDARGGDHALALDGHGGRAALPHRVDHRLDVLLVHDEPVGVLLARLGDLGAARR